MKNFKKNQILLLLSLSLLFGSCKVQNLFESSIQETNNEELFSEASKNFEYCIKTNDKLTVSIWGHDDLSVGSVFGIYNSNEVYGKWVLVDQEGKVSLPQIGQIQVKGFTINQIADLLKTRYSEFIQNPIIVVKVLNKKVSLLGALNNPATIVLDEEKVPLMELIGRAEGFDYYADKSKVKLIRKVGGASKEYVLDLTKMDTYDQANISIQPGDVIYVPNKNGKAFDKKSGRMLPFMGLVSSIAVIFSVVK